MIKKSIAILIVAASFYACRSDKKPGQADDSSATAVRKTGPKDTLSYTYDSVKVYSQTPVSKNKQITDTAKAVAVYPVFNDELVNKFFTDRVIGLAGKQEVYKNYKELTAGFMKEFDDYQLKNPADRDHSWFEDLNLKVAANYPNYLSVLYTYIDYKGGAHPNTLYTYFNYNPKTYQTITLDSLVTRDGMPKLRAVAEKIFRKNEKLSPKASLSEGYFFADGIFSLAETFTVTKEGLKFLYNPYEIKDYAAGTTELVVPFKEIRDILKPSSILVNFK